MIISRLILPRMRNVSDKSSKENQKTHFVFGNPPPPENLADEIIRRIVVEPVGHR